MSLDKVPNEPSALHCEFVSRHSARDTTASRVNAAA